MGYGLQVAGFRMQAATRFRFDKGFLSIWHFQMYK
jgi:hypothetical protein